MTFQDVLLQINTGATVAELVEKFRALGQAVLATGKAGSLTLTIKLTPLAKNNADIVTVAASVKLNAPEADDRKTVFFLNEEGDLATQDPGQMELPLRPREIEFRPREVSNG